MSSSEPTVVATQRWRLDLAYDGSGLAGFAYQPEYDTVVGLLRSTLARTLRLDEEPLIVGAGRTDAGVHALAQVIHVDLPAPLFSDERGPEDRRLLRSLNGQLAGRVRVLAARAVEPGFHARFSARWREYRYLVIEAEPPALAFTDSWSWTVAGPLDVDAMNRAGAAALGTHDFRAFCRRPAGSSPDAPIRREVLALNWARLPDDWSLSPANAPAVRLVIRAQSFCHNMVRCLTSVMVAIGQGRLDENTVRDRLVSLQRDHLPPPAPAGGLALIGVGYDEFAGGPSGFVR